MRHLILGGTGTVGRTVVQGLLDKGESVRVLTRSEERARTLPAGATAVIGDLSDPDTYGRIFRDLDTLFLLIGHALTELHQGLAALNEARRAGVQRIVYLSASNIEPGLHVPHMGAKVATENAIKASGVPYTILRPNNFYQNDRWFREAILGLGIYAQPIGDLGLSRVDVRDIGDAAVNALTSSAYEGRTYTLVGPKPLTGADCAQVYSDVLGQEVRYAGNDLQAFAQRARHLLPSWVVWDYVLMFQLFQERGMIATEQELRDTEEILGHPPRRYEDFAHEFVAAEAVATG